MAAPALSLILCVVLVVSFWPEVRAFCLGLERLARKAEEGLDDLWTVIAFVGLLVVAVPIEVFDRIRRR